VVAEVGLAPEIFYCSTEDEKSEYMGGLVMVVMEYVGGVKTVQERYGGKRLPGMVYREVKKAMEVLHGDGLVFGDWRGPNILVEENGRVWLVDFDWCGEDGVGRYPVSLNDGRKGEGRIKWHEGVERGGLMKKEHDLFRLECLKVKV